MDTLTMLCEAAQQSHTLKTSHLVQPENGNIVDKLEVQGDENKCLSERVASLESLNASLQLEVDTLKLENGDLKEQLSSYKQRLSQATENIKKLLSNQNDYHSGSAECLSENEAHELANEEDPGSEHLENGDENKTLSTTKDTHVQLDDGDHRKGALLAGKKPFKCEHCGKMFRKRSKLAQHKLKHTTKKQRDNSTADSNAECQEFEIFSKYDGAIENGSVAGEEKVGNGRTLKPYKKEKLLEFECNECHKLFTCKTKLTKHMKWHSGDRLYQCGHCDKRFMKRNDMTRHENTHNKKCLTDNVCSICNRKCLSAFHLENHMRSHTGEKPFSCGECGKTFARKSTLRQHSIVHREEKAWQCDVCSAKFARKDALRHHQVTHGGEKHFECDTCGKRFLHKSNMRKHTRIHTGEKPYKCATCDKNFTTLSQLKRHMKIHTGQRDYVCDVCNKAFIEKQGLQNHFRIHTGEKPFACEICSKAFTERNNLLKHKRIHSGDKMYLCETCGASFNRKGELERHEKYHLSETNQADTYRQAYELGLETVSNNLNPVSTPCVIQDLKTIPILAQPSHLDFRQVSTMNDHQRSGINNSRPVLPSAPPIVESRQILPTSTYIDPRMNIPDHRINNQDGRLLNTELRPPVQDQRVGLSDNPVGFHDPRLPTTLVHNWNMYNGMN